MRCGAASRWSRAVSLPAVTPRRCRALRCGAASRWCFAPSLARQALPRCRRIGFREAATSSAQTSASLHPSRSASLAGSSHSRGTWASTVCAEEFPTPLEASFAILQLRPARLQPHPAQVRQIASQTGVLPRRMRFVAGRGHCSSKSPRARILVLGTSGAQWPARWPRFELTERVAKSQLSGYEAFTFSKRAR